MLQPVENSSIYIKKNGLLALQESSGFANRNLNKAISEHSSFRMASVSKQFTAACIVLLKNNGFVNYSDVLSAFFPNVKNGDKISLCHLLTHSSGIVDYEQLIPPGLTRQINDSDVLKWVSEFDSLYFEPRSGYRYSNTAFCILSQVIEKVSGLTYSQFLNKNIFEPLNMSDSFLYDIGNPYTDRVFGYTKQDDGGLVLSDQSITSATMGDGCIYTSVSDYKKWIEAIVKNRLFDLKRELLEVNYPIYGQNGLCYGLGWFNFSGNELYHTGSTIGFSNVVYLTLDSQNAVVYFSNLTDSHSASYDLIKYLKVKPTFSFASILALTD